jgi:beta-glucosidase
MDTYNSIIKYFDKVIVVLNVGSVIELNDIEKNEKTSILISFLPGMEAGNAVADVLVGAVNPSGHLTDTWARTIDDYPTTATFLESEKYVKYKEGLFVGYRYFEEDENTQSKVVFPFGHGLSYTTFDMKNKCEFDSDKKNFKVTSTIKNTGQKSGKQVVQVYVKKPQNEKFVKVQRELVAFGKTKELKSGESQTIELNFKLDSLASYDDTGVTGNRACYVLEKGEYLIYVADSVAKTRNNDTLLYTYKQNELVITQKLENRLVPHDPEVADANTKPNFDKLFIKKEQKIEENFEIIQKNEKKFEISQENVYTNLPTNKFNEINFKTVLQKGLKWEDLVDTMTNEELAFLSYGKTATIRSGTGIIGGFYNSGPTAKYNIPYGDTNDGPAGLRQSEVTMGSAAWPCSTALASSFDVDLIKQVGEATGKEARRIGCSFWLAPGMNIHRSPLCGRNFEYYSEDPLLAGKMASAITKGLQSKRVSITLKHFAFNNKESNRNGEKDPNGLASDSRMAERVAREIYLKGFEIAVKEGKPWSIMTSYNRMNSMKTAESYDLLTGILRQEWEYDGLVMTDWGTKSKNDREAHAGNDIKMPNNNDGTKTILDGLVNGVVTRNELKRNIIHLFTALSRTAAIDALFLEPKNKVNITDEPIKIKVYDHIYRKYSGISYEECQDEDKGYNPTNTVTNSWISLYVENDSNEDKYKLVRIRYSSIIEGFGVAFKKYEENLGEITNLEVTGDWQIWNTTSYTTVKIPKGNYELTLLFLGYGYASESENKGNINWIEIL